MSVELLSHNRRKQRFLRQEEIDLVRALIGGELKSQLAMKDLMACKVFDMNDGGMGSIHFLTSNEEGRGYGGTVAEVKYVDEDRVLVSITLSVDNAGELYELDFWKVDFSPLSRYPRPESLTRT